MNTLKPLSSFALISLLALSFHVGAQQLNEDQIASEFVRAKGLEFTLSSDVDRSIIPDSVYYQSIFRQIIQSRPDYLTDEDWAVIVTLPSHSNPVLVAAQHDALLDMCGVLEEVDSKDIAIVAEMFESAQIGGEDILNEHYQRVIAGLSLTARARIEEWRREYENSKRFGYSRIDMVGLAAAVPQVAEAFLKRGCAARRAAGEYDDDSNRPLRMIDERIPAIPMTEIVNSN